MFLKKAREFVPSRPQTNVSKQSIEKKHLHEREKKKNLCKHKRTTDLSEIRRHALSPSLLMNNVQKRSGGVCPNDLVLKYVRELSFGCDTLCVPELSEEMLAEEREENDV